MWQSVVVRLVAMETLFLYWMELWGYRLWLWWTSRHVFPHHFEKLSVRRVIWWYDWGGTDHLLPRKQRCGLLFFIYSVWSRIPPPKFWSSMVDILERRGAYNPIAIKFRPMHAPGSLQTSTKLLLSTPYPSSTKNQTPITIKELGDIVNYKSIT